MRRKAIKLASQTIVVSLPIKWIKKQDIKKGEELNIEEKNNILEISKSSESRKKTKLFLDLTNTSTEFNKIVASAFKAGYDEIEIKFESYEKLENIYDLIRKKLPSFGINRQDKNTLVLESIYDDTHREFNQGLNRFLTIISHLGHETLEATEKIDFEWSKKNTLIKEEPDNLANFLRRNINLNIQADFKRTAPLYTIIEMLLYTADIFRDINIFIYKNKIKINKDILDSLKDLVEYYDEFLILFKNFSIEKCSDFSLKKEKIEKKIEKIILKKSSWKEKRLSELLERLFISINEVYGPTITMYI